MNKLDVIAAIDFKYPGIIIDEQFIVEDDGTISKWGYEKPKPSESDLKKWFKEKQKELEPEFKRQEREAKIIQTLGADDKLDAIVKQLNIINESIATGDNTKVKEVDTIVKQILNS